MITTTSLTHPAMIAKIDAAMRSAAAMSLTSGYGHGTVTNRSGAGVLTLRHHRGSAQAFQFWRGNTNITATVLAALRRAS